MKADSIGSAAEQLPLCDARKQGRLSLALDALSGVRDKYCDWLEARCRTWATTSGVQHDVIEKLQALRTRLRLEYGAVDMRLTPEGDYVFLEINPNGEYLYYEEATGLPISMALAEHLQRGRPTT